MVISPEIVIGGAAALVAAIGVLFRLVIKGYTDQLEDKDTEIVSLRSILKASLFATEVATNKLLALQDKPAIVPVAPVVAEHSSPTTPAQAKTADLATMRARVVASFVALDLPPIETEMPPAKKVSWLGRLLPPWK